MPERPRGFDPDEPFSLFPAEGEEVLTHLLRSEQNDGDEDEFSGDQGS